jgi:hypothetical protein
VHLRTRCLVCAVIKFQYCNKSRITHLPKILLNFNNRMKTHVSVTESGYLELGYKGRENDIGLIMHTCSSSLHIHNTLGLCPNLCDY